MRPTDISKEINLTPSGCCCLDIIPHVQNITPKARSLVICKLAYSTTRTIVNRNRSVLPNAPCGTTPQAREHDGHHHHGESNAGHPSYSRYGDGRLIDHRQSSMTPLTQVSLSFRPFDHSARGNRASPHSQHQARHLSQCRFSFFGASCLKSRGH